MNALEFRFAFYARNFERSVSFYRDILGMQLTGGWDRPDGKGALLLAGGTGVIEIYGAAEGKTYTGPPPAAINLALRLAQAADVDNFYEMLLAVGAQVLEPPENRHWGHRSFIVLDPDSIPVHIYCEIELNKGE
jgi:catechol 2,3-dioxygenase-like lactoylglutathione lyase family enzyme